MGIQIIIPDTDNLSDQDRQVLAVVAGTTTATAAAPAPAPAKKAAAKKAAAAPAPVEDVEPDEEPDVIGEPTMADAVAKATELVSAGKANDVKAVLTDLGVKRVSELKGDDIAAFLDSF